MAWNSIRNSSTLSRNLTGKKPAFFPVFFLDVSAVRTWEAGEPGFGYDRPYRAHYLLETQHHFPKPDDRPCQDQPHRIHPYSQQQKQSRRGDRQRNPIDVG